MNRGMDECLTFDRQALLVPIEHSALEVRDLLKAKPTEHRGRGGTAYPRSADCNHVLGLVRCELRRPGRQLPKWNQEAAGNVPKLAAVLFRLTDVEKQDGIEILPTLVHLLGSELPHRIQLREAGKFYRVILNRALIRLQGFLNLLWERRFGGWPVSPRRSWIGCFHGSRATGRSALNRAAKRACR